MRPVKLVSLAAHCSMRFAAEECRVKGISNGAGCLVIFFVVLLISSYACADSPASTAPPQVNLWYGNYQTFGTKGIPQQWINVLGDVSSPVGIAMLTYSLNGTPDANLNWGPANPRLVEAGDFNADIDYALLRLGLNSVVITAIDYLNQSTQQTVYINNVGTHLAGNVGEFVVDFRQATNATIQNWVQIVDGVWDIGVDGRIRNTQIGYDRAFLIGDANISGNYDIRTEFVLHSYDDLGWAFGTASGWLGHTLDNYGYSDPSQPYIGHPFPAWGVIGTDFSGIDSYRIYTNFVPLYETELSDNNTAPAVALETPYMYHYRVRANSDGLTNHNSLNVWPKGTTEPAQWMVEADTPAQAGSILFDAHNVDVSIGPIIKFTRSTSKFCCKDLNGDGHADIVWRNASGEVYAWLMNGLSIIDRGPVENVGNDWQIAGVGDFNGDRKADILWRNASGEVYIWLMNGVGISSQGSLGIIGNDWQIAGVGDLNGDGHADIVWRNASGEVYAWLMNGLGIIDQGPVENVGNDWQIAGVGDFNGDRKADIVWRNASGEVYIWLMNGVGISSQGSLGIIGNDWQIAGIGDLNGDGHADIVWRDASGEVYVWLMNGLGIIDQGPVENVGNDWQIAGVGDFSGDRKADIVWRNASGEVYIWLMNGLGIASQGSLGIIGSDWSIE